MKPATLCWLISLLVVSTAQAQRRRKIDPCANAQSQLEMNICAGNEYKAADATLNQVYKQLMAILDDDEKLQLKEVENTWIKYRDTNCEFVADQYKGGSMRPMVQGYCLADMTKRRTAEIREQIKERKPK
jgi:uncharacterized protein YecT (DUF1311 family)